MLTKLHYIIICVLILLSSCGDSASDGRKITKHPGYEYMPNMYRSPSYETYSENPNFSNNSTARLPVPGTIPFSEDLSYMPFEYDNSLEDYLRAGRELRNPLETNSKNTEDGKVLYGMFCAHCHGKNGDGKGSINHPVYSAVPSYLDNEGVRRSGTTMKQLSDGHIYHAITYGLAAMGPHASQITPNERWKIIMYVNELKTETN
tara:strand:+ start:1001 stop:1612 length:612 start_codon:yes stop_codon:yes gene_type:complete